MTKLLAEPTWRILFAANIRYRFGCCIESGVTDLILESFIKPMGSVGTARYRKFFTSPIAGFNLDRR